MKDYLIPNGILKNTSKLIPGHDSFKKIFREMLTYFGLTVIDPCCPEFNAGFAATRFNTTTNQLEYSSDGITWSNTAPTPAPTNGVVDDTANTFGFTLATGYSSLSDYERTINGGTAWATVTSNPITGITGARAIGQVGVRVKANGARPASSTLSNSIAYTA